MRLALLFSSVVLGTSLSASALAQTSILNPPSTPARPDPSSTQGVEKAPSTGVGAADNGTSAGSGSDTGKDHVKKSKSAHKQHKER